jgi:hypothetical protein
VEYVPVYLLMAWEIRRGRPLLREWIHRPGTGTGTGSRHQ